MKKPRQIAALRRASKSMVVVHITPLFRRVLDHATHATRALDGQLNRGFYTLFQKLHTVRFIGRYSTPFYKKFVKFHYRLTAAGLTALIVVSALIPVYAEYQKNQQYVLNAAANSLLGKANPNLTKKLTHDTQKQLFQFNKDAIKTGETQGNPLAKMQSKIGGAGAKDEQQYSVDAPEDLSKGATYYDNQAQLSFKVVPQFGTMKGREVNGHLVYPMSGAGAEGQVAYTLDAGGLKENVILYKSPGNTYKMSYKLDLPNTLEAKLLPSGEVGIYSADPSLFGNITYGSSDDQAKVERARVQGAKTYLTFKIPAPVVTGLNGGSQSTVSSVRSSFAFENNMLTVTTTDLDKATYPLAIDPTVAVDSTSDFQSGNMEDNNSAINSGTLSRGGLTGGAVGTFTAGTALGIGRGNQATAVYNGYIYQIGGNLSGASATATVTYAKINTDGTLSAWTAASSMLAAKIFTASVAYNGYVYSLGGSPDGNAATNTVEYAKINADGSLGSWSTTTSLGSTNRFGATANVYNGYVYVAGGCSNAFLTCGTFLASTQYAKINADGSLGSWTNGTSFATGRYNHASAVYNNTLYILGGLASSTLGDVQYAKINADGSLSAWTTTTAFSGVRTGASAVIMSGYLYVMGGNSGSGSLLADTQYAPVNANGTLGDWAATNSFATPRWDFGSVAYNGYIYAIGGTVDTNNGTWTTSVQYAKVTAPGTTTAYTSANTGATFGARYGAGSVTYNGYLYVVGGYSSSYLADISYAKINANGTLGAWASAGSSLPSGRINPAVTAANGYIYVAGGYGGSPINTVVSAPVASNGTIGSWATATNSFANGRRGHASVIYNGYIYVSGGYDNGLNYYADTQYALLCTGYNSSVGGCNDTAGNVGTWASTGATFSSARTGLGLVTDGGYMYAAGGINSGGANNNEVLYSKINANGTLGAWTSAGTGFATARSYHGTTIYNGNLYIIAGNTGTYASDTQYAPIKSDGTIGSWVTVGTALGPAAGRYMHSTVSYGGYVYALGGLTSASSTGTTDAVYTRINNGGPGTVGAWAATSSFSSSRAFHSSVAYNGYVYVIGGEVSYGGGSTSYMGDIQSAPITSNGSLGAWTSLASLPTARSYSAAFAYNNNLYIIGGTSSDYFAGATYYNDAYYVPIKPDGALGTVTPTTSLPTNRYGHAAVAYNGYAYVTGGATNNGSSTSYLNEVLYAPINANGTLGAWAPTTAMPAATYGHGSVVANGYIYVIGGNALFAPINANGTLGAWLTTTSPPISKSRASTFVYNGYIYVVGGSPGILGGSNDVQLAPINANGTLGNWSSTTAFTTARAGQTAVAYNGYIYVAGGTDNTIQPNYYSDVQYASVSSIARKSRFSKLIDMGANGNITALSFVGLLPDGVSGLSYSVANPSTKAFGTIRNSTTVSCLAADAGRYVQVYVTFDDSGTAGFGDAAATSAHTDSLTVTNSPFSAPPNLRLRHGAYFLNEVKQDFSLTNTQCSA